MNTWKWVPNALTLGNLLGGVVVCWAAASGAFLGEALVLDGNAWSGTVAVATVWALAMFCDVLDGWAARALLLLLVGHVCPVFLSLAGFGSKG